MTALARLARTPDGQTLVKLLNDSLQHTKDILVDTNIEGAALVQGQARSLRDLLDLFKRAEQVLSSKAGS